MGECHCSKIAIMQLFHELKQQFPALPDYVVSRCIAQNSHDKESCVQSLRVAQESRSPSRLASPAGSRLPTVKTMSQEDDGYGSALLAISRERTSSVETLSNEVQPVSSTYCTNPLGDPFGDTTSIQNDSDLGRDEARNSAYVETHQLEHPKKLESQSSTIQVTEPTTVRAVSSVSLTLKTPSSQPPVGPSSDPHLDPQSFQNRLEIGTIPALQRPSSLSYSAIRSPSGLPARPPSRLPRPTTPASQGQRVPTTGSTPLTTSPSLGAIPRVPKSEPGSPSPELPAELLSILDQVDEEYKPTVKEQLIRKDRMTKALEGENRKLEQMRKEVEYLSKLFNSKNSLKDTEEKLRSEIYMLQLECDKLAAEFDQHSDSRVPLGETNEEFYKNIYTGQPYIPQTSHRYIRVPPPLPSQPPALEPAPSEVDTDEEADEEGPSWVCQRCTFDNHPLLNQCEQCDMPRVVENAMQGTRTRRTNHKFSITVSRFYPRTSR